MWSSIDIAVPAYRDAIHCLEARNRLRVDLPNDDDSITSQLAALRKVVENATSNGRPRGRKMVAETFDVRLDAAPTGNCIGLPWIPVLAVVSIVYTDTSGEEQEFSDDSYAVNRSSGLIRLKYGKSWPSVRCGYGAMTIRYTAGTVTPFEVLPDSVIRMLGRDPVDGERLRALHSGDDREGLPGGLRSNTDYFVVEADEDECRLSLTSGGGPVTVTENNAGINFLGLEFDRFRAMQNAMLLALSRHFQDPGSAEGLSGAERSLIAGAM